MNNSEKYYLELDDTPLYNWEKLLDGEFKFIRKNNKKKEVDVQDMVHFYKLYDKYIEKYGLSKEHSKYVAQQKQLIELKLDFLETGNKFMLTQIEIANRKLDELRPKKEGGLTIGQQVVILSKWMGQWFDKRKRTVTEYKDLIKEYERAN